MSCHLFIFASTHQLAVKAVDDGHGAGVASDDSDPGSPRLVAASHGSEASPFTVDAP